MLWWSCPNASNPYPEFWQHIPYQYRSALPSCFPFHGVFAILRRFYILQRGHVSGRGWVSNTAMCSRKPEFLGEDFSSGEVRLPFIIKTPWTVKWRLASSLPTRSSQHAHVYYCAWLNADVHILNVGWSPSPRSPELPGPKTELKD